MIANVRSKWEDGNLIFYPAVEGSGAQVIFGEVSELGKNTRIVPNDQTIQSVIDSITDASATNPYVVLVPPGDFLVSNLPLHMPSEDATPTHYECINYITIQGSGIGATRIYATTDIDLVYPGKEFYLKDLTLENTVATSGHLLKSEWWQNFFGLTAVRVKFKSPWKISAGGQTTHATSDWLPFTFINCVFEASDDMFWLGTDQTYDGVIYTFINPIVHFDTNNARIFISNKESYVTVHVYNPICTGITTGTYCRPFKLTDGEMNVFNPYIDVEGAIADNCSGVYVRDTAVAGGKLNVYGGVIKTAGTYDVYNHASSLAELNLYGTQFTTLFGDIGGKYDAKDETATGTYTLNPSGVTIIDSSGGAATGTLPDGHYIGQRKHIVMTNATASSTITVTHLAAGDGGDGEVGTFDAVDEVWILEWSGTEWVTIKATCTFV